LEFQVVEPPERWLLDEEDVPESPLHDAIIELLKLILKHRFATEGREALVAANLACRWDPDDPRVGMDPDIVWIEPPPPGGEELTSLRIWEPGHTPPRLAVEVVSRWTADKDYLDAPARAARLGVEELWVFDPLLLGPGLPHPVQVWQRVDGSRMRQLHAGSLPARTPLLDAWLVATQYGRRLRIASDASGRELWPSEAEAARSDAEAARSEAEAARRRAEEAEAELERLRRERSGGS
jgi:Uma2 family endonuclease